MYTILYVVYPPAARVVNAELGVARLLKDFNILKLNATPTELF